MSLLYPLYLTAPAPAPELHSHTTPTQKHSRSLKLHRVFSSLFLICSHSEDLTTKPVDVFDR